MTKDDGGPAFPVPDGAETMPGMSLRDYFAAKAMPMAMKRLEHNYLEDLPSFVWGGEDWEAIAEHSYAIADAMLKARKE